MDPKYVPNRKVGVGAAGGAIGTIVVWLINTLAGPETVDAVTAGSFVTVCSFLTSYFVPERKA